MEKRLLSIAEACEYIGVDKGKMYQLSHSLGFPSLRVGNRIKIDKIELDKWIANQVKVRNSECRIYPF